MSSLGVRAWIITDGFCRIRLQLDKEGINESDCKKGGGGGDYSREAINRGAGLFEEIR